MFKNVTQLWNSWQLHPAIEAGLCGKPLASHAGWCFCMTLRCPLFPAQAGNGCSSRTHRFWDCLAKVGTSERSALEMQLSPHSLSCEVPVHITSGKQGRKKRCFHRNKSGYSRNIKKPVKHLKFIVIGKYWWFKSYILRCSSQLSFLCTGWATLLHHICSDLSFS